MKDHLSAGYGSILCGTSGRKGQSKGVIMGLSLDYFLLSNEQCSHCVNKLMDIVNRKRRANGKSEMTFEQYKEWKKNK